MRTLTGRHSPWARLATSIMAPPAFVERLSFFFLNLINAGTPHKNESLLIGRLYLPACTRYMIISGHIRDLGWGIGAPLEAPPVHVADVVPLDRMQMPGSQDLSSQEFQDVQRPFSDAGSDSVVDAESGLEDDHQDMPPSLYV